MDVRGAFQNAGTYTFTLFKGVAKMAKNGIVQAPHRRVPGHILAGMALIILTFGVSTQTRALAYSNVSPGKGKFIEFPLPNGSDAPFGITAGPDGNLWFTEQSAQIAKITPQGQISEFDLPSSCLSAKH
jgi:hypothetical protein